MPIKDSPVNQRRIQSSYITSTISISLVLLMLSLLGFLVINARMLSDFVKESINFSVIIKPNTDELEILRFQKELDANEFIKSTEYITAEKAAAEFKKSLGEDFIDFLGFNPLLPTIEVKLNAQYANDATIEMFEKKYKNRLFIKEFVFEKNLINLLNDNIKRISIIILAFCGLLLLIAVALMNNTIRLVIFSKRFLIRTMQLVGATRFFIRKPFLLRSIWQGIISSTLAFIMFAGLLYLAQKQMHEVVFIVDLKMIGMLFGLIALVGIFINLVSTYFAVNKYLSIKVDDLY